VVNKGAGGEAEAAEMAAGRDGKRCESTVITSK